MGLLRNRFRDRSRPPPGPPADMSPVVPSSPTDDIPLKSPLRRTNPPARVVQGSSSGRSLGSVWSGGRSSSGPSARSSLLDQASRLRRFLRERKPQSHSSADSTTVDDVPDTPDVFPEALSDAEFSIAAAARDSSSLPRSTYNPPVASGSSSVSSNVRYATSPTSAYQRDSSTSTAPRGPISLSGNRGLPNEMQQGETCTDGCLTFVVPPGWIATRTMDSFCLVNNLSLGFVRAVKASNAAEALLETDRLQVMSHVTALSSPVFDENGNFATVNYLSTMGKGKGEEEDMIEDSIQYLKSTVRPQLVPCSFKQTESTKKGDASKESKAESLGSGYGATAQAGTAPPFSENEKLKPPESGAEGAGCFVQ